MLQDVIRATRSLSLSLLGLGAGILATASGAQAQTQVSSAAVPQIQQQVENSQRTTLRGNVHPLANAAHDRGAVENSLQTPRMQMLIKRPADREAAFKSYIADIHQKSSPNFHKWLTPDQIAQQYGPADSDVQTVTAWLQSQGFTVSKLSRAKSVIEFSGTAGQVKSAFTTQIHKYLVNGETHYANSTDPQIPSALAPVVSGIVRMNDFHPKSQLKQQGSATYNPVSHKAKPLWNYPYGTTGEAFFVAPGDFAVQYDTTPLATAGVTGAGQTIGIINDSNIDLTLVTNFRSLFGLTPANNLPNVVIDGTDPGVNGDAIEAYLDVEWSGAVAPAATIDLYIAADTTLNAGLDLAAQRAVDDDQAKVLSLSFGACEQELGATENAFYNSLWEQAAAQGQTVMVSTGDSGSEGCYNAGASTLVYGLAVNGFASTPYNVAVGGTDFYYSDYASTPANGLPPSFNSYWASGTSTTPATSILKPIPEQPWNDSQYGFNTSAVASGDATYYADEGLDQPNGGSGGASACATFDSSGDCLAGYAKPAFQSALTPADSVRDIPDVSLFAANGLNYSSYVICAAPGDCNSDGQTATPQTVTGVGGTSASSPSFAGIMALVNQKYGPQGQADYVLYPLAKQFPAAFHDVTAGTNNEPCYDAGTNSAGQQIENVTACVAATDGTLSAGAYSAATGYDEASGLGSVDANVLVTDWNKVTFTASGTTLALSPASITHGATETLTATVTGATSGDVAFVSTAPLPSNKGLNFVPVGSNGVATLTSNALPGGTYSITADYGGNGTVAASASTAQSITVSPEASNINLAGFQTGLVNGTATENYITNGTSYPYGTAIYADIQPVGTSVTQPAGAVPGTGLVTNGVATGSATFTDTGNAGTATVALNTQGIAEWSIGNFAIGTHSISATYSGDASFKASSSPTPVTFTITKGTPTIGIQPFVSGQQTGSNLSVQVFASYVGVGTAPTGTVSVMLGMQTQTGTLAAFTAGSNYAGGTNGGYSVATVTFANVSAGASAITASYAGDGNWNAASGSTSFQTGAAGLTATATTLTVTPTTGTLNNATTYTLSSTVTGSASGAAPTGSVYFFSNGDEIAVSALSTGAAGSGVSTTTTVIGANLLGGANQIVAAYGGDNTYITSFSSPVSTTVDQSDFTLASQNQVVSIAAGASGSATVNLASVSGFDAAVNLTCASPNSAITCSVSPGSVTVNGLATAKVTINVATASASNKENKRLWYASSSAALACFLLFGIPAKRRAWRSMLGLLLFAFLTANIGCGGGGSAPTPVLGQAATPTFSPAAGAVTKGTTVTLSDSTTGAAIFYTTDGTTPTTASTAYSTPIAINSAGTINAIATASGYTQSAVGTAAYTITTTPVKPVSGTNPTIHNVSIQVVTPSGTSVVVVTGTVASS